VPAGDGEMDTESKGLPYSDLVIKFGKIGLK